MTDDVTDIFISFLLALNARVTNLIQVLFWVSNLLPFIAAIKMNLNLQRVEEEKERANN